MSDVKLNIHTDDGKTHHAQAPLEIRTEEFIGEIVQSLQLSSDGNNAGGWALYNKGKGAYLESGMTLGENGVRTGHELYLSRRQSSGIICPSCRGENSPANNFCEHCGKPLGRGQETSDLKIHVHLPNGTIHSAEAPAQLTAREFVSDLVRTFGYTVRDAKGGEIIWKLDDKDTGGSLDADRTLGESGVHTGHHLYLRAYDQVAPPPDPRPMPLSTIAAILGGLALLGVAAIFIVPRILHPDKPEPPHLPPPQRVTLSIEPRGVTLGASQHQGFRANITGSSNQEVEWSVEPQTGTISSSGSYEAPATVAKDEVVTITASSKADPHVAAKALVTLKAAAKPIVKPPAPISIAVKPTNASVWPGQQQEFIAKVSGCNRAVIWSRTPELGNISTDGVFRAPTSMPVEQTVKITATSKADPHRSASVMLVLLSNVQVQLDPGSATVAAGKKQKFKANVNGTNNKAVAWSINPELGSISEKGEYKAPSSVTPGQTIRVTATSKADPHKSASAEITLVQKR